MVRDGNKKQAKQQEKTRDATEDILDKLKEVSSSSGGGGVNRKIDNISTFLLRLPCLYSLCAIDHI